MSEAIQRTEAAQMSAIAIGRPQIRLSPQQDSVLKCVRESPGQTIRQIHEQLGVNYECVRTAVHKLLKYGLVETRGNKPQYLSPLYAKDAGAQAPTGLSA